MFYTFINVPLYNFVRIDNSFDDITRIFYCEF